MPKTILLAEDDADILDILYYMLTDDGYQVIKSYGNDTVTLATIHQPRLIILDHRLLTCWGADICRELKAGEATKHIPVILMSATMNLEETARAARADAILKKPFDMPEFLALVTSHCDKD